MKRYDDDACYVYVWRNDPKIWGEGLPDDVWADDYPRESPSEDWHASLVSVWMIPGTYGWQA